ncbi:MAG TPA: DMT family transporter, partial [candidate division Zixibacteria bacterium]|nr:DMT family transporter [candidate division Zixibacteria bacterium]
PIWIFLAAVIHLKEKLVLRRAIGIVVALSGVAVIMSGGAIRLGTDYLLGDAIILVAVLAWAYYTILGKDLARKYGALRVTAYALSSGSLIYFPFGIYRASQVNYALVPLSTWLSVVYVAIGTSVISYVLYYWVLKYFDASRIAVFHNLQPVIASAVALVWLGEPLGTTFFIGGAVALIGVIIAEQQTFGRLRRAQ